MRRPVGARRTSKLLRAATGVVLLGLPLVAAPAPASAEAGGGLLAWGTNHDGEVGDGTDEHYRTAPVTVSGLGDGSGVVAVDAGWGHSLAVRSDGSVMAWGESRDGQLGDGSFDTWEGTSTPVQVTGLGPGSRIVDVAAGVSHSLAVRADGSVLAWGSDSGGQLGDYGYFSRQVTPVPVHGLGAGSGVVAVAAGWSHSLALRSDGSVLSWGSNVQGQLGDARNPFSTSIPGPVHGVGPGSGVVAIDAGFSHSIALKADGSVLVWGADSEGQLGRGGTGPVPSQQWWVPTVVNGLGPGSGAVGVSATGDHSLVVRANGAVVAWGSDDVGQLGDGGADAVRRAPVGVSGLGPGSGVVAVAAGESHSLALRADGSVLAWGFDGGGALGDGDPVPEPDHSTPVAVSGLGPGSEVVAVAAGAFHSLAIRGVAAATAPTFAAASPPASAVVGKPYGPYTFSAGGNPFSTVGVVGGALPNGLSLTPTGQLAGTPTATGTFTFSVRATNGVQPDALTPPITITVATPPEPTFVPVSPTRVWDTRSVYFGPSGRVGPGAVRNVTIAGKSGLPASGITAVVLNVTADGPTAGTFVTVWPTGETPPLASNLNIPVGDSRANMVTVKVGAGGQISFRNHAGSVDLMADVAGWYGPDGGQRYTALPPARIWDSRVGPGPLGRFGGPVPRQVTVTGTGGVPSTGVSAVVLNVTAVNPTTWTFITAWPTGETRPYTSNINLPAFDTRANLVVMKVGDGGQINFANAGGSIDAVVDVAGYFGTTGAGFNGVRPARVWDSRVGPGPVGRIGAGGTRTVPVLGVGGVPAAGVSAVVLNLTAVGPSAGTFVTAWPTGQAQPLASNLNVPPGDTRANLVVVKVGAGGQVSFANSFGGVDLIADVAGWYGLPET